MPVTGGEIWFDGQEITHYSEKQMRPLRAQMQIIFQDPYGCLDPRKTVFDIIAAPLRLHGMKDKAQLKARVLELMEEVGLRADYIDRFPHEFSGGQRQRIGIAREMCIRDRSSTHPSTLPTGSLTFTPLEDPTTNRKERCV